MTYHIYTDASYSDHNGDKSGYGYLIRTKNSYITVGSACGANNSSSKAEVSAIGVAVRVLFEKVKLKSDDVVAIHSDCYFAYCFCRSVIAGERNSDPELKEVADTVTRLNNVCRVKLLLTEGHTKVETGNTLVDRLAKHARYFGG